jgi:hypothetical protein
MVLLFMIIYVAIIYEIICYVIINDYLDYLANSLYLFEFMNQSCFILVVIY